MIKTLSLLCLLAVVIYAKPASNKEENVSEPVKFLELIKLSKIPETDNCDVSGRLSLFTGPSCAGRKTVYVCDGSCFDVTGGQAYSLKASDFPDGYSSTINFFNGRACNDGYLGTAYVKVGTCYGDKDKNLQSATSFACVPTNDDKPFTKGPASLQ